MTLTIAVIAPGAMGSAVGACLVAKGAEVLTVLDGRSLQTVRRAGEAGMRGVSLCEIIRADMILSILPPGEALALAQRLAPLLTSAETKPTYIDCNAVSPAMVQRIETVVRAAGAPFADAGIIGGPPRGDDSGPAFYVAGLDGPSLAALQNLGLRIKPMTGPVGAASGLKMSYAGITKGLTALSSAMMAAASRAGVGEILMDELAQSQPALVKRFQRQIPDMYPKAYRWVEEMRQISQFLGPEDPARLIFAGMADHYDHLATEVVRRGETIERLEALIAYSKDPSG